jgi:hypothetical protein
MTTVRCSGAWRREKRGACHRLRLPFCVVLMSQLPASAAARIARVAGHMMRPASTSGKAGGMLDGQVAIITGSGQGIGAAAALLFAQHGAAITVCDIDATKAQSTAASIVSAGGRAIVVAGDVMDPTYADKVVAESLKAFGKVSVCMSDLCSCAIHTSQVNILVNNAGFTWDAVIHKMTDKQWHTMCVSIGATGISLGPLAFHICCTDVPILLTIVDQARLPRHRSISPHPRSCFAFPFQQRDE